MKRRLVNKCLNSCFDLTLRIEVARKLVKVKQLRGFSKKQHLYRKIYKSCETELEKLLK